MTLTKQAWKLAAALGLAGAVLVLSADPASAGPFRKWRRSVVVAPTYVVPAPTTTVVTTTRSAVIPAAAPMVLGAPVRAAYAPTTTTVVSPVVPTTFVAPAPVVVRQRVIAPRRVLVLP